MNPFRSLVGFCPRNGGMADGKNGRMVEWREWLHTYFLRCTHTDTDDDDDDDDDDTLIFYSIDEGIIVKKHNKIRECYNQTVVQIQ